MTVNRTITVTLILILARTLRSESILFEELYNSMVMMYQPNETLDENMNRFMSIICPESVFCSCAGDNYTNCRAEKFKPNAIGKELQDSSTLHLGELRGCCSKCSCEPDCYEYHNCCWEMPHEPHHYHSRIITECVQAVNTIHLGFQDPLSLSYNMVTGCFSNFYSPDIAAVCKNPDIQNLTHVLPVSSKITGRVYRNELCAICNNDTDIEKWQLLIKTRPPNNMHSHLQLPLSYEELLDIDRSPVVYFLPPSNFSSQDINICIPNDFKRNKCLKREFHSASPNYDFLETACLTVTPKYKQSSFYFHQSYYKNIFCFFCSTDRLPEMLNDKCGESTFRRNSGYLILLKLSSRSTKISDNYGNKCSCTEWFDKREGTCRPIICPQGHEYVECRCEKVVLKVSGLGVDTRFEIFPFTEKYFYSDKLDILKNDILVGKLLNAVSKVLKYLSKGIDISHFSLHLGHRHVTSMYYLVSLITVDYGFDIRDVVKRIFDYLQMDKVVKVGKIYVIIRLGLSRHIQIDYKTYEIVLSNGTYFDVVSRMYQLPGLKSLQALEIPLQKTIYCKRIALSSSEKYTLVKYASSSEPAARQIQYVFNEVESTMCFEDFQKILRQKRSSACKTIALAFTDVTYLFALHVVLIFESGIMTV